MACPHGNVFTGFMILILSVTLSKTNHAAVTLNILNPNDFAPDFPNSISSVNISAGNYSSNRLLVARVEAEDPDTGASGNVTYSISGLTENGRNKFILTPDGYLYLDAPVEAGDFYVIVIKALDSGMLPRQDHTAVVVSVEEERPEGPEFPMSLYTVRVSEGIRPFSHIVTVQAMDPDNGPLTYNIVTGTGSEDFVIDSKTGVLRNVNPLSVSKRENYMLLVTVNDSQGLSTNTLVDIKVTPRINYVIPSELYLVHIEDTTPVNSTVFTVPIVDSDNDSLTYSIVDGNTGGDFAICNETGTVKVAHALDLSRQPIYELTITVTNSLGETASTRLRILISKTSRLANDQGRDVVYTDPTCKCDGIDPNRAAGVMVNSALTLLFASFVCSYITSI